MSPTKDVTPELIRRCLNGDDASWNRMIALIRAETRAHLASIMHRYGLSHLISAHLDPMENYFYAELHRFLHHYNFSSFPTWVAVVRKTKAIQYLRQEMRHHARRAGQDPTEIEVGQEGAHHGARTRNGETVALEGVAVREILERLEGLPEPYGLVCRLHFVSGVSCKEIARLLSRREATVRSQLFRGIRLLRARVKERGG